MPATTTPRLILFADLRHKKGISFSRSTIRRLEFAGMFPRHVHPSPGTTAWVEAEVDEHLVRVIAQRDVGQRRVDAMQQQTQHHGRGDPIQMGLPFGGGGHYSIEPHVGPAKMNPLPDGAVLPGRRRPIRNGRS
jgi:prophage regulatory protein